MKKLPLLALAFCATALLAGCAGGPTDWTEEEKALLLEHAHTSEIPFAKMSGNTLAWDEENECLVYSGAEVKAAAVDTYAEQILATTDADGESAWLGIEFLVGEHSSYLTAVEVGEDDAAAIIISLVPEYLEFDELEDPVLDGKVKFCAYIFAELASEMADPEEVISNITGAIFNAEVDEEENLTGNFTPGVEGVDYMIQYKKDAEGNPTTEVDLYYTALTLGVKTNEEAAHLEGIEYLVDYIQAFFGYDLEMEPSWSDSYGIGLGLLTAGGPIFPVYIEIQSSYNANYGQVIFSILVS